MTTDTGNGFLITARRVWDGLAERPIQDGFVLVEGNRIRAVGQRSDIGAELSAAFPHLDLPGATLLPGLINGHVHLALSGSSNPVRDYRSDERAGSAALALRAAWNLRSAVESGVTTVRDLGTPNDVARTVRSAVASGTIPGPRVLTSGRPLTVTGGHCHWFGRVCDSAPEIRVAVRSQVRDGADWIKLMLSGGNLTPRTNPLRPQYSEAEVRACAQESDRLGVPLAVHAYDPESIRFAVAAGATTVEHCLFETSAGIRYDPALGDLMAEGGVAFVPTISAAVLSPPKNVTSAPVAARFARMREAIHEVFRKLLDAGVPVLPGSDAGVPQREFGDFPGDLAAYAGADGLGLSARGVLLTATSMAATRLGIDAGVLEPGRRADLLAVHGDPLDDITALHRPRLVIAGGRRIGLPSDRCSSQRAASGEDAGPRAVSRNEGGLEA